MIVVMIVVMIVTVVVVMNILRSNNAADLVSKFLDSSLEGLL